MPDLSVVGNRIERLWVLLKAQARVPNNAIARCVAGSNPYGVALSRPQSQGSPLERQRSGAFYQLPRFQRYAENIIGHRAQEGSLGLFQG